MMTLMVDIGPDYTLNVLRDDQRGHTPHCRLLSVKTEDKQVIFHFETLDLLEHFENNIAALKQLHTKERGGN
jgi:hypothetical protein